MWRAIIQTGFWPGLNRKTTLNALAKFMILAGCLTLAACASSGGSTSSGRYTPSSPSYTPPAQRVSQGHVVDYRQVSGWGYHDPRPALTSFLQSCTYIVRRNPSDPLSPNTPYAGRIGDWLDICAAAQALSYGAVSEADARTFFEDHFTPVELGGEGKLTGYYEPIIDVRSQPDSEYSMAIRAVPGDLFSGDVGQLIAGLDQGYDPYSEKTADVGPRGDIESYDLGAPLAWGHPIDVFFLQVQGSGRLRFEDGREARAAFAAHNGYSYVSIGRVLINRGELDPHRASKQDIENWLWARGPSAWRDLFNENPRYVFFRLIPIDNHDLGPVGAQGVPLTPLASLAVDRNLYPLGAPIWIESDLAEAPNWTGLVIAQDAGGAITGPLRGDMFYGWGEAAERRSGRQNAQARWTIFLPHHLARRIS